MACEQWDWKSYVGIPLPHIGDPVGAALINEICKISGAAIVICSTWAHPDGWVHRENPTAYIRDWLSRTGLNIRLLHADSLVRFDVSTFCWTPDGIRAGKIDAIKRWLQDHPEIGERYAIIDDDLLTDSEAWNRRVVSASRENGISMDNFKRALRLLGRESRDGV